jgi:hypothetical protein
MDQERIDVLRKAICFSVTHSPDVREVCLKVFASGFVRAAVFP